MKHDFTQLQLTRLVYGETTKAEEDMLLELSVSIPQLADSLKTLQIAKKALGQVHYAPSNAVINRILGYSASSAPVSASWSIQTWDQNIKPLQARPGRAFLIQLNVIIRYKFRKKIIDDEKIVK